MSACRSGDAGATRWRAWAAEVSNLRVANRATWRGQPCHYARPTVPLRAANTDTSRGQHRHFAALVLGRDPVLEQGGADVTGVAAAAGLAADDEHVEEERDLGQD